MQDLIEFFIVSNVMFVCTRKALNFMYGSVLKLLKISGNGVENHLNWVSSEN